MYACEREDMGAELCGLGTCSFLEIAERSKMQFISQSGFDSPAIPTWPTRRSRLRGIKWQSRQFSAPEAARGNRLYIFYISAEALPWLRCSRHACAAK